MNGVPPTPLLSGELKLCLERLDEGTPFKAALEELLLTLPIDRAEHLALLMREGRAAWIPLLFGSGGRALFIGNAFSGTPHVLATAGFQPVLYDHSLERMRFEAHRCLALTGVPAECVLAECVPGGDGRLPFEEDAFELVVQEEGLPGPATGWGHDAGELRRVSRGEVVVVANNRLGYKRSLGARGSFEIPSLPRYLAQAIRPARKERTLGGYLRALRSAGCDEPHPYALYPHAEDYTHVVDLDGDGPRLHLGPKEKRNKLKMAGLSLGLFPLFTPSFSILSAASELTGRARRIERVLIELSERLGEDPPVLDELLATRGNTVVLQTRAAHGDLSDPLGRWSVHLPLSPTQHRQIERHHQVLERLWTEGQRVPAPEPLYRGPIEGLDLTCERRLPGLGAPELSGNLGCLRRMLDCVARDFARLVVEPPREIDERLFEKHFGARFDLVAGFAGRAETARNIARLRDETRERVIGAKMPLVLYHADLRGKHVNVNPEGEVQGYLDWGSSTDRDVPYFDLLHLVVHERKQAAGSPVGSAWRELLEPDGLRDWERDALERYARSVEIDEEVCEALERCYPIFVAAMAESNWDYSRPRWLHLQFGI